MSGRVNNVALREQARERAAFLFAGLTRDERFWLSVAIIESLDLPLRFRLIEASAMQLVSFVEAKRPLRKHAARAAGGMVQIALQRLAGLIAEHAPSVPPASSEGDVR